MSKKYSGNIEIWVEPKWRQGSYSGNGLWEINFNSVNVKQFIDVLEGYLKELKAIPERDGKGRFISLAPKPPNSTKEKT